MDWISVEDALPEREQGFVLVCVDFHQPRTQRKVLLAWCEDGIWRTENGRMRPHWEVTHWMALPEMPGAGGL